MKSTQLSTLFLTGLLMAGVGCKTDDKKDGPFLSKTQGTEIKPRVVFDNLDSMSFTGLADTLVSPGVPPTQSVVFELDFEDGEMGPLTAFGGFKTQDGWVEKSVKVVDGPRALDGQKSIELKGGVQHGVSLRTQAIPVSALDRFKLSYLVAGERVGTGTKVKYGGASVIWYRAPSPKADINAQLKDPAKEKRMRLDPKLSSFWIPGRYGTTPKVMDEAYFEPPPEATHLVISFDLNRPEDDRKAHKSRGSIRFDDIKLEKITAPLSARHRKLDDGIGEDHPLKVVVEKKHPARKKASERRYALYAPAPSDLSFQANIPEQGVLSLGYALTEDARATDDSVNFEIVIETGGKSEVVHAASIDYDDVEYWKDVDVDLSAFAGQAAKITLRTSSDRPAELYQLPEAAAVWSYPTLHSRASVGRNYILVAFDTLSAKRTSTYGYPVENTPEMTRVASEGVLFKRAVSPSAWTLASFSSMLTGLDPARHRAGERQYGTQAWRRPLAPSYLTLAEQFRNAGWETRAWINNPYLTKEFGLEQGYSHFVDYNTRSSVEAFAPAWEDIEAYFSKPVGYDRFVFVHIMDPHGPYRPNGTFRDKFVKDDGEYSGPFEKTVGGQDFLDLTQGKLKASEADKRRLTQLYEAVINYGDHMMGKVFDISRSVSREDGYAFLITADHGEELWDHDLFEHGHTMYDELLSVPMVAYVPGKMKPGREVDAAVGAYDVAPTLLHLAGIPNPGELNAVSLLPYLEDQAPAADRILYGHQMLYGTQRNSIEKDGMKLIYNQSNTGRSEARSPKPKVRYELYDLKTDPNEQKNLYGPGRKDEATALMGEMMGPWSRSLGDHYVLYMKHDDGRSHRLKGTLKLKDGGWLRYTKDMVWPLPNGKAGKVKFSTRRIGNESVMTFEVNGPQALVAFDIDKGAGPVSVELTLDGQSIAPETLKLGKGTKDLTLPGLLEDDALRLSHADFLKALGQDGQVVFGLLDETPELVGTRVQRVSDAITAELEALGYTDGNAKEGAEAKDK